MSDKEDEMIPRDYQVDLMKIALKQNTIIYLPTGTGKTFIAILVLKAMSHSLSKPYSEGGKMSVILVNTVALVDQHVDYLRAHTILKIAGYSGDMKLDNWHRNDWLKQFNENQVLVMTSQIFLNLIVSNFIGLKHVNLLIFDECHHAVDDHPMRQIMKTFQNYKENELPRVLGLTATLLNRNCKISDVEQQIKLLETTYHSKVATLDGFEDLVGFRTNPCEVLETYKSPIIDKNQQFAIDLINKTITSLGYCQIDNNNNNNNNNNKTINDENLELLEPQDVLKQLKNLLKDFILHIEMFGIYGGMKTAITLMIKIERLRIHCQDIKLYTILNTVMTICSSVKQIFENIIKIMPNNYDKIYKLSNDKLLKLFKILENYQQQSNEDLCCIIFVQRRATAKILHHLLDDVRNCNSKLNYLKSNFIVGLTNNPYKTTRESLYLTKKNREVLLDFTNREINIIVSSNVLEEGVDIKKCTLVIKFDKSEDYRSYIQSKGRARHMSSYYYTMIENRDYLKYQQKYQQFQKIENCLNDYLVGKNLERDPPNINDIKQMYNEDILPPYFVNGPGTAQVNTLTAISLLSRYCQSLPSDQYTTYSPEWYRKTATINNKQMLKVVIKLPIICPINEHIESPYMYNKKNAKRAAALQACIQLHKHGELNDDLLPVVKTINDEDVSFLFKHWPENYHKTDGNRKKKRLHDKQLLDDLKLTISPNQSVYLHIINIEPLYSYNDDYSLKVIQNLYKSNLKYGFLTAKPLPDLCKFPIYDSYGEILITIDNNQKIVELTDEQINEIKDFHYLIFNDLLEILKPFLLYDNDGDNTEHLLLIPIIDNNIDFTTITNNKQLEEIKQPSALTRKNIEVNEDDYLYSIVSPWYRNQAPIYYVVTQVCMDKTPLSEFPNVEFNSFQHYYDDKHSLEIYNLQQPLLLVKGLSKKLNLMKPRTSNNSSSSSSSSSKDLKRKRDKRYDEIDEMLIPELVVKQRFPSSLWIQARLLPTIINRLLFILKLYKLQQYIGNCLDLKQSKIEDDLELDLSTLNHDRNNNNDDDDNVDKQLKLNDINKGLLQSELTPAIREIYNKDYAVKRLEAEYPWWHLDEPKDIERDINVNLTDIEYYEKFISQSINLNKTSTIQQQQSPNRLPALTYKKDYVHIDLKLLNNFYSNINPKLSQFYQALTTIQSNDIVNLERLETLGDSFLKFVSSLYCLFRFKQFNEGQLTVLKSKLVSNRNLYYLGKCINLGGLMRIREFEPKNEWLPPSFIIPKQIQDFINHKQYSINSLFNLKLKQQEQKNGIVTQQTLNEYLKGIDDNNKIIINNDDDDDGGGGDEELNAYTTMGQFINKQLINDKCIADCVEALLGVYFLNNGLYGGIKFLQFIELLPKNENLKDVFNIIDLNPIINTQLNLTDSIRLFIPQCDEFEKIIGYQFKNRAYLLQALTHTSFQPNRLTLSYQRLEFIGDAILDFLITIYIYENCGNLNPGEITDLRSSLVNNNIFACLLIRNNLHKFLLLINQQLQHLIDKFVKLMEMKNYQIDDEILILLDENDLNISECIDIPKILGDIFEAIAGAIYLDCGKNLQIVWKIFYKLMWREIDTFSKNVPKNVVRRLYECNGAYPNFSASRETDNGQIMVALEFMCEGRKKRVYGIGTNRIMARRAAAKIALRALKL